jgi:hypothetical protein
MLMLPLITLDVGLEVLAFFADRYRISQVQKGLLDYDSPKLNRVYSRW